MVRKKIKPFRYLFYLVLVTVFQCLAFFQVLSKSGAENTNLAVFLFSFIALEWLYVLAMRMFIKQTSFELEMIAFFLSGLGIPLTATASYRDMPKNAAEKQVLFVIAGVFVFIVMRWLIANADRVTVLRMPAAILAAGLLAFNILAADEYNGAKNWVNIGGFSIQPSEFVKIAFIFVGAATLDKLQTTKSVFKYLVFAAGCIGALFIMRDFGTALVFFATLLVILYMRSGDWKTIAAICVVAVLGAVFIFVFADTVKERFATYRHVWDDPYGKGWQQVKLLIYSASGGLFGVGLGNGELKDISAADTDLVFGMVCEEYGLIVGFTILLIFPAILVYTIASAKSARTSFYVISACSAASLLVVQMCLNVFGATDLIPFTGVTLPFVSRGGSSMISCWALLAFIKSVDPRAYPKTFKETQLATL